MLGLEVAKDLGAQALDVFGDSQLVLSQVTARAKCVEPTLAKFLESVKGLLVHF